ncbi:hypothetical protein SAMN04487914_1508 [Arthrobacter sp. ok909]|uniref:hypothetical protein n=1 Tax=Arthrobacter sp. ok909 TaxID=1761746 RepID=UPI0008863D8C|nr:hypothetical protein [Arthrobacter sp. ok909]SDP83068.1 hypothetical protein SAMN04487914_1508 [Arthrobacter sp. ok909]
MKNRSLPRLLLTLLPALVLAASGCTPTACPAVGFVNLGPVELDLSGLPAGTSVSACFGTGDRCDPVPVTRDGSGRWIVPQTPPFVQPDNAPVPLPRIRVVAAKPDQSISDHQYGIEHTPPRGGCDNSYALLPVEVL